MEELAKQILKQNNNNDISVEEIVDTIKQNYEFYDLEFDEDIDSLRKMIDNNELKIQVYKTTTEKSDVLCKYENGEFVFCAEIKRNKPISTEQ